MGVYLATKIHPKMVDEKVIRKKGLQKGVHLLGVVRHVALRERPQRAGRQNLPRQALSPRRCRGGSLDPCCICSDAHSALLRTPRLPASLEGSGAPEPSRRPRRSARPSALPRPRPRPRPPTQRLPAGEQMRGAAAPAPHRSDATRACRSRHRRARCAALCCTLCCALLHARTALLHSRSRHQRARCVQQRLTNAPRRDARRAAARSPVPLMSPPRRFLAPARPRARAAWPGRRVGCARRRAAAPAPPARRAPRGRRQASVKWLRRGGAGLPGQASARGGAGKGGGGGAPRRCAGGGGAARRCAAARRARARAAARIRRRVTAPPCAAREREGAEAASGTELVRGVASGGATAGRL